MTAEMTLAIGSVLAVVGAAFAAYSTGYDRGRRAGHDAEQCAAELRLANESRRRHPSRCEECS